MQDPNNESKTLTFANSPFHRIIPGFMMQGGDITAGNGTGEQVLSSFPPSLKFLPDQSRSFTSSVLRSSIHPEDIPGP